jgi:hypothetical protein
LTGATSIGIYTFIIAQTFVVMQKFFDISGGNLYGFGFLNSNVSDAVGSTTVPSSTTYNPASTLYVFFTVQLGTSADSCTFNMANITN